MYASLTTAASSLSMRTLEPCPTSFNFSNCDHPYPDCFGPVGFNFDFLWQVNENINSCGPDTHLISTAPSALTQAACVLFSGTDSWTWYAPGDVWNRLTTWKFPLFQLVAIFPRPPLGARTSVFSIVQLLGNPVGTLKNLQLKVASCQSRAQEWSEFFAENHTLFIGHEGKLHARHFSRDWMALATIMDSYDEWGSDVGDDLQWSFQTWLKSHDIERETKLHFLNHCRQVADRLSADRSTKSLPVLFALSLFISTIAISFGRTKSSAGQLNTTTYINVEVHSVAFSALYFWIIPATALAAVIGVSTTEHNLPRILREFEAGIVKEFARPPQVLRQQRRCSAARIFNERTDTEQRIYNGGIYSWYPRKVRFALEMTLRQRASRSGSGRVGSWGSLRVPSQSTVYALFVVLFSLGTGLLTSALVPPVGFGCRCYGELAIAATWVGNFALDYVPVRRRHEFTYVIVKNTVVALATLMGIVVTQFGVFNRCSCYTLGGRTGLQLPELPDVASTLSQGIQTTFPLIAFISIVGLLFGFPLLVHAQHPKAIRVFLRRDDGRSNGWWWRHVLSLVSSKHQAQLEQDRDDEREEDPMAQLLSRHAALAKPEALASRRHAP